eukprot:880483-Pleurochrysis_carterae.AAC.1
MEAVVTRRRGRIETPETAHELGGVVEKRRGIGWRGQRARSRPLAEQSREGTAEGVEESQRCSAEKDAATRVRVEAVDA